MRRAHFTSHRVAELDFRVLDRVAAEERRAGLGEFVEASFEDCREDRTIGILGKRGDRERGERAPAHRVNVAHRIGGRDLPIHERIVDDGREEVDRLHERPLAVENVHTRIVGSPVIDQDPWVVRHGQITQDLGELASRELARSTRAGSVIGESFHLL